MDPSHPLRVTRRRFLALSIGAMTQAGCMAAARTGFIDAHSHVWTPDTKRFPLGPWITPDKMEPASFTAKQLLATAEPCGVDRAVLIQHAPYYGDDNSYLIHCAKEHPGRFSIVAIVDERRSDLGTHLRHLKQQGVRGIRIGPSRYADRTLVKEPLLWLKASAMRKLWAMAADEGLLLCPLLSAEHLPTLEPMLAEFPRTQVVIDHFGHAEKPDELSSLLKLAQHRQVHVKVSGFYKFGDRKAPYDDLTPMIKQVVDAFTPARLLWGSDCPYQLQNGNDYKSAVALIQSGLDFLDAPSRQAILRDNSQRLFFDEPLAATR